MYRHFPKIRRVPVRAFSDRASSSDNLLTQLQNVQRENAEETVPWFLREMPAAYFRSIEKEEQLQHLNAITSLRYAQQPELMLKSPCGKIWSFIQQKDKGNTKGMLSQIMSQLPNQVEDVQNEEANLARVKIFTSGDNSLALDVFRYGVQPPFRGEEPAEAAAGKRFLSYCQDIQDGKYTDNPQHPRPSKYFNPEEVSDFLRKCNAMHVKHSSPRRLALQMLLYHEVKSTENVALNIEHGWETLSDTSESKFTGGSAPQHMITIASANVLPKNALEKASKYLALSNLNVLRAHLDVIDDPGNGKVVLNRVLVSASEKTVDWEIIEESLKYLKWVDDRALNLAWDYSKTHPNLTLTRAEIIIALANMLHGLMAKKDPFAYALGRIFNCLTRSDTHLDLAVDIATLFEQKFTPTNPLNQSAFKQQYAKLEKNIHRHIEAEDERQLFLKMLQAVHATLRTNRFVPDRFALALRLAPEFMGVGTVAGKSAAVPFGTFFIHGRRFNGFHVRFRDISRGGLRVVAPHTIAQHAYESSRQYNECFNLAYAQQLKNKDIAEGGSKAVVLVQPQEDPASRDFVLRKSVKAFSDALLDLNSTDAQVKDNIIDYYGQDELIYLGPDENIIPADIDWITAQAQRRSYPIPRAFMSSKPEAGINHKVYGVTSEGVAVFVQVGLEAMFGPETERPFTVKMTGGTDGDVAGNMIRILYREYKDRVKFVGICDGTAVIENPKGIRTSELLRLVESELPLSAFEPSSDPDEVFLLTSTPEGIQMRNSLPSRVQSDVFIPAGGRPSTISSLNYENFLVPNTDGVGKPLRGSSPLIVEGANLFITPEARQLLFDKGGVQVVKDSSANKCGVICSSVEIIASMLLETQEFLQVKPELVADVLTELRTLARVEAQWLFREHKLSGDQTPLPVLSERLSAQISRLHDALVARLKEEYTSSSALLAEPEIRRVIEAKLPPTLRARAEARLETRIPLPYLQALASAALSSKVVYAEGLDYCENISDERLADVALAYLRADVHTREYLGVLHALEHPQAQAMADIISRCGTRAGVEMNMCK